MDEPDVVEDRRFAERFRSGYRATPLPAPRERARLEDSLAKLARRPTAWHWARAWLEPRAFVMRPVAVAAAALALMGAGVLIAPHLTTRLFESHAAAIRSP